VKTKYTVLISYLIEAKMIEKGSYTCTSSVLIVVNVLNTN